MALNRPLRSKFFVTLIHISVWAIIFILPLLFDRTMPPPGPHQATWPRPHRSETFQFVSTLLNLSFIPLFYLNALVFVPRFFNRKKWPVYALMVALCIIAIVVLNMLVRSHMGFNHGLPPFMRIFAFLTVCVLITSTAYSLIQQNLKSEKIRKEKESENLKTELSFLRSQVSPHFLFNTLNNLVSLARKKSDLLEPSLLKLSGLLQYMLYESDDEKISIHKEIEYLENYVDLQRLRFGSDVKIEFHKNLSPLAAVEVVPMILIPFVENAFKHGVVYISDPEIIVHLTLENNLLTFNVLNKYNPDREEKDKSSGIGLTNVKRRLNLLYPDCVLNIATKDNYHTVTLSINL